MLALLWLNPVLWSSNFNTNIIELVHYNADSTLQISTMTTTTMTTTTTRVGTVAHHLWWGAAEGEEVRHQ